MPRPLRAYVIPYGAGFGAARANGTRTHEGCDYHTLDGKDGPAIYGTGPDGRVSSKGYDAAGYGFWVRVTYPGNRVTRDAHMPEASPLVIGAHVDANTIIGHVGHTGNAAYADPPGSHDHHEIRINGVLVDPEKYYGASVAGVGTPITTEEDEMFILRDTNPGGAKYIGAPGGGDLVHIEGPNDDIILSKLVNGQREFTYPELQVVAKYLKRLVAPPADTAAIAKAVAAAVEPAEGTDLSPILAVIKTLPAATVAALKSAL